MLKLNGIAKTFNPGTVNEKKALDGVDLHLAPGDFATVVGSNGAGKSTLFHAMKGTAPHMTIEENLALAYLRTAKHQHAYFSRTSKADRKLFREQLARLDMGLEDRMGQPVGLLSGGQRQALTLLMSTMVPPKILLLDEHTAALDPGTAEKVLNITREVVAEHKITTMMVTHNMHQALELGNRTLMMDSGRIVLDVQGEERKNMAVSDLLEKFKARVGEELDNDRILLS